MTSRRCHPAPAFVRPPDLSPLGRACWGVRGIGSCPFFGVNFSTFFQRPRAGLADGGFKSTLPFAVGQDFAEVLSGSGSYQHEALKEAELAPQQRGLTGNELADEAETFEAHGGVFEYRLSAGRPH